MYCLPLGPVSLTVSGLAGTTSFKAMGHTAHAKNLRGANLQLESEWVTLRASRVTAEVSLPAYNIDGDRYAFNDYGVEVDHENFVAQAEFVQRRSNLQPAGTDADGWYVLGGYRMGPLLPYAVVSRTVPKQVGVPELSAMQSTTALGVRWDVLAWADVKFQIDHVDTDHTPGISFTTPLAFTTPGEPSTYAPVVKSVTVFSVTFDFEF